MKKQWIALCGAALLASGTAAAQDLDHNDVQGGLAFYPSFGNQDLVGVDLAASFLLTPQLYAIGGLTRVSDDIDLTALHVGGAYRMPLNGGGSELYGGLTLEYQDVGFNGFSVDDTALGLRGGLRHRLSSQVELSGQLRVVTGDMDYFGARGSLRYFLNERLSLLGELDVYDGETGLIGGLHYSF